MQTQLEQLMGKIKVYLADSSKNPYNEVIDYIVEQIPEEEIDRKIEETEVLLHLVREGIQKPYTREDTIRSGSPGVIVLGTHYAYPLQLSLLSSWVYGWVDAAENFTPEDKIALGNYIMDGVRFFDPRGLDWNRYTPQQGYPMNKLFPETQHPDVMSQQKPHDRIPWYKRLNPLGKK